MPPELWLDMIKAKAVAEFHHGTVNNGYEPGSDEWLTYNETILELEEQAKEQKRWKPVDLLKICLTKIITLITALVSRD